jgi:3-oxoacid CoA-transferase subunit A
VDKWYRLHRAEVCGGSPYWFAQEQLTQEEMSSIAAKINNQSVDFVLTHTCPIAWEPQDLFLNTIDQGSVDKTMEIWLNDIKNTFDWKVWCFGHYHDSRLERPRVQQFYQNYEWLSTIWNRWEDDYTILSEWWLTKAPMYYAEE